MLEKKVFVGTVLVVVVVMCLTVVWIGGNVHLRSIRGYRCSLKAWNDNAVTVLQPRIAKNCSKLFGGDEEELKMVNAKTAKWKNSLSDDSFFEMTRNCSWVRDYFSNNLYVTKLERSFPLAFTFVVHNSPQQVVRLLKVIYRANNRYCIIPDSKSRPTFIGIFINIAACLSSVQVASKLIPVRWGEHSIMDAQMICLKDLLDSRQQQSEQSKWKYVINLCGKELPLATNHVIVSRLVRLNGSSAISPRLVRKSESETNSRLRGGKIPFHLPYYKSMTYMGLPYDFASFLITNSTAIKVRQFFESRSNPEEHFYASLSVIPGVPGGFNRNVSRVIISHAFWQNKKNRKRCKGKIVHNICIPRVDDLSRILKEARKGDKALFHNKYFMDYDHTPMDCMEEELIARNKREFGDDDNSADGCGRVHH